MKKFLLFTAFCASLMACSEDSKGLSASEESNESSSDSVAYVPVPVDYSAGRAMNKRLGKGMNLGNSWDSKSYSGDVPDEPYNFGYNDNLDAGWGNPIKDEYFQILKDAGFNSVRIPVRWQHNSDPVTHTVNPERLAGVKEDIQLAMDAGLAVIVNFHHYSELNEAANNSDKAPAAYEAEKAHFFALWEQVAEEMNAFPDSLLVLELLNEPTVKSVDHLNEITLGAYEIVRKKAPNKTIMIESYHAGKFADIDVLRLPQDGNIIFSGHYYEPFTFSHEGHGYNCVGDESYVNSAMTDMQKYVAIAQSMYPDVNGGHIPMNLGEFGVAGQTGSCGSNGPSDRSRLLWTKKTIRAAETYDMSWHYWGFTKTGGFEAYDLKTNSWLPGMLDAFQNPND